MKDYKPKQYTNKEQKKFEGLKLTLTQYEKSIAETLPINK